MGKIDAWQCDVCKKLFNSIDNPSTNHIHITIVIGRTSQYEEEYEKYFDCVCPSCRKEIEDGVNKILNKIDVLWRKSVLLTIKIQCGAFSEGTIEKVKAIRFGRSYKKIKFKEPRMIIYINEKEETVYTIPVKYIYKFECSLINTPE